MEKIIKSGKSFLDFKKESNADEFPIGFSTYIKSFGDIYFWEKGNFHVITKIDHAKEILTSDAFSADRGSFFISRMPNLNLNLIGDFFGVVRKMMVMNDDVIHSKQRKLAMNGFDDKILNEFKSKLSETIKGIIEEIKGQDHFDFVEKVAKKLPSTVLADLFAIPTKDREQFLSWSNTMTGFFGGASDYSNEAGIEVNLAAKNLKNYFGHLMNSRRENPQNDFVSIMLKSQIHFDLAEDEIISQLIMLLVAGMATTTDQISNIMYQLLTHPEVQDNVKKENHLIPQMIEECKRIDPAVTFIFRVARKATHIGGQPIAVGEVMFISTHSLGQDLPDEFHPEELNIHRGGTNFAYGHGAHYCLGAKLARLEMQGLFKELLTTLPKLRLSSKIPSVRDHYSLSFSGFKTLGIEQVEDV